MKEKIKVFFKIMFGSMHRDKSGQLFNVVNGTHVKIKKGGMS